MKGNNGKTINKFLYFLAVIVLSCVMLLSLGNLMMLFFDSHKSDTFSKQLQENVLFEREEQVGGALKEEQSASGKEDLGNTSEEQEPLSDIPIGVDFDGLLQISEDVVAWLYCPDTEINCVVAQSDDNKFYLRRLLDGTDARCGTLFLDYRNDAGFGDWNSVIYGHNMKNGSMFATLLYYREQSFYEEHPVMYLYTPSSQYTIELIAGFTTPDDDPLYSIPMPTEEQEVFLQRAQECSTFSSLTEVSDSDRLVTLSTCAYEYENARFVLIGRLVAEGLGK